jgi:hypothetical protein
MYTVDSCTGALTEMVPSSVATGTTQQETAPEAMAIDAAGRFAYVANLVSNAAQATPPFEVRFTLRILAGESVGGRFQFLECCALESIKPRTLWPARRA